MKNILLALVASLMLLVPGFVSTAHAQEAVESAKSKQPPPPPPPANVAGAWSGSDTSSDGGGPMTMQITQSRKKLRGTFSVTTGDSNPTGTFNGTIKENAIHATFHTTGGTNHHCTAEVVATVDGDQMTGSFIVHGNKHHCNGQGQFTLTRQ